MVLQALDTELLGSGKLWFAAVACYFTGNFEEGVNRFNAELESNSLDAEELLWRQLCTLAAKATPRNRHPLLSDELSAPDPRAVFGLILEPFGGQVSESDLMEAVELLCCHHLDGTSGASGSGSVEHDLFCSQFYTALLKQASVGLHQAHSSDARGLMASAQQLGCCDNIGLLCRSSRLLPSFQILGSRDGYNCPKLIMDVLGWSQSLAIDN